MMNNIEKYTTLSYPHSFTGIKPFYKTLQGKKPKIKKVEEELLQAEAYAQHRYFKSKFKRNRVIVPGIDYTWQADLLDVRNIAKANFGYKFILTVIDVFSKYGWARAIKTKTAKNVLDAFKDIVIKSGRKPRYVQTDAGLEFNNKYFKEFLCSFEAETEVDEEAEKEIEEEEEEAVEEESEKDPQDKKCKAKWYKTYTKIKAGIVERFNRTIRERMWRFFTNNKELHKKVDQKRWFSKSGEILEQIINGYNNTYHSSIKNKPINITKENESKTFKILYGFDREKGFEEEINPKFKVGDIVRLALEKKTFEKGYTANWSKQLYTIDQIIPRFPVVYRIRLNENNQLRHGTFYENELLIYKRKE